MSDENKPANVTDPESHEHHVVGPVTYSIIFGILLLCTLLTVLAAHIEMGVLNPIVALGIATLKGVIVILFFMHVKYQSRLIKMTVAAGFFTFLVLITMTLSDYMSRAWASGNPDPKLLSNGADLLGPRRLCLTTTHATRTSLRFLPTRSLRRRASPRRIPN